MDHVISVPAGAEFPVKAAGDYIYCKFSTHPVRVMVNQEPVLMEAGDKWRVAGGFTYCTVTNPDPERAALVRLTIGEGDFQRQIVQGEITVNPGIRKADGEFVEDTRHPLALEVRPATGETGTYVSGDIIARTASLYPEGLPAENERLEKFTVLKDGDILSKDKRGENKHFRVKWPPEKSGIVPEFSIVQGLVFTDYAGGSQPLADGDSVYIVSFAEHPAPNIDGTVMWVHEYDNPTLLAKGAHLINDAAVADNQKGDEVKWIAKYGTTLFYSVPDIQNAKDDVHAVDIENRAYLGHVTTGNKAWGIVYKGKLYISDGDFEGEGKGNRVYDAETWARLPYTEWELPEIMQRMEGVAQYSRDSFIVSGNAAGLENGRAFGELAVRETQVSSWGYATPCTGRLKPGPASRTKADLTRVGSDEGGRVKFKGELIRAALELYAGRPMPSDYLDYVYRVEAENLNGLPQRTIDAGGNSFAGAEIADQGTAWFPQTVTITVREGLF